MVFGGIHDCGTMDSLGSLVGNASPTSGATPAADPGPAQGLTASQPPPLYSECSVCSERFLQHDELVRHMITHQKSHRFSCRKCDSFRCKSKHELAEHIHRQHVTIKRRYRPSVGVDRRLRCVACGIDSFPSFSFFHDHHLYHHVATRPEPLVVLEPLPAAPPAGLRLTLRRNSREPAAQFEVVRPFRPSPDSSLAAGQSAACPSSEPPPRHGGHDPGPDSGHADAGPDSGPPAGRESGKPASPGRRQGVGQNDGQVTLQDSGQVTARGSGQVNTRDSGPVSAGTSGAGDGQPDDRRELDDQPIHPDNRQSALPAGEQSIVQRAGKPTAPHGGPLVHEDSGQSTVPRSEQAALPSCGERIVLHNGESVSRSGQPTVPPSGQSAVPPSEQLTVPPSGQPTVPPSGQSAVPPCEQPTVPPSGQPTHSEQSTVPHSMQQVSKHVPHSGQSTVPSSGQPAAPYSGQPIRQGGQVATPASRQSVLQRAQPVVPHSGQPVSRIGQVAAPLSGQPTVPPSGQPTVPHSGQSTVAHSAQPSAPHSGHAIVQNSGRPAVSNFGHTVGSSVFRQPPPVSPGGRAESQPDSGRWAANVGHQPSPAGGHGPGPALRPETAAGGGPALARCPTAVAAVRVRPSPSQAVARPPPQPEPRSPLLPHLIPISATRPPAVTPVTPVGAPRPAGSPAAPPAGAERPGLTDAFSRPAPAAAASAFVRPVAAAVPAVCQLCGATLPDAAAARQHAARFHGRPPPCRLCSYWPTSGDDLQQHLAARHGGTGWAAVSAAPAAASVAPRPRPPEPAAKRPRLFTPPRPPSPAAPRLRLPTAPGAAVRLSESIMLSLRPSAPRPQAPPVPPPSSAPPQCSLGSALATRGVTLTPTSPGGGAFAEPRPPAAGGPLRCRWCPRTFASRPAAALHEAEHSRRRRPPAPAVTGQLVVPVFDLAAANAAQLEALGVCGFMPVSNVGQRHGQLGLPVVSAQTVGKMGANPRPVGFFHLGQAWPLR